MKSGIVTATIIRKPARYFLEFIQLLGAGPKTHPSAHNMKNGDISQKKEMKKMQQRDVTDMDFIFAC